MLNFFKTLIEYIQIAFQFLINIVSSLANLVAVVATASSLPVSLVKYVFAPLGASILACVAFGVLKLLVGRDNL